MSMAVLRSGLQKNKNKRTRVSPTIFCFNVETKLCDIGREYNFDSHFLLVKLKLFTKGAKIFQERVLFCKSVKSWNDQEKLYYNMCLEKV